MVNNKWNARMRCASKQQTSMLTILRDFAFPQPLQIIPIATNRWKRMLANLVDPRMSHYFDYKSPG